MDPDLLFVLGTLVFAFACVSIVSAFSQSRPPRVAAIAAVIGGGMIVVAFNQSPGGYDFADIPEVFAGVIGRYLL